MPTSRSSSDYPDRNSARQPEIPRPRGIIAEEAEQEGISWEGQVLVVGQGGDIAARLIVTTERFLLTHRDDVLLEAPRTWLVPAPLVIADNGIRVSVTPEGIVPGRDTTERLQLRIRDGRGPAMQLVAILTGRSHTGQQTEAEFPNWNADIGAGRSNALPHLPKFESRQDDPPTRRPATDDPETRGVAPLSHWRSESPHHHASSPSWRAPDPEPVETTSRAARFLVQRPPMEPVENAAEPAETTGAPVTSIAEERRRRAGWVAWTSRVAVLAVVILAAGWFGREYLPEPVTQQLPAFVTNDLASNLDQPEPDTDGSTAENGDGTDGAENNPADIMPTEAALGVGGVTTALPDGEGEGGSLEPSGDIVDPPPPADNGDMDGLEDTGDAGEGNLNDSTTDNTGGIEQDDNELIQDPPDPILEDQEGGDGSEEQELVDQPTPTPEQELTDAVTPTPGQDLIEPTVSADESVAEETALPTAEPSVEGTPDTTMPPIPEPTTEVEDVQEPTLEPQRASVNPDSPPAQTFADKGFRYSVEGSSTGSSLPELPQVADVGYGEWVVLAIDGTNWTESEQVFDMSRFTLLADGEPIQLDVGNSWVASQLNYTPAYGNTDAILWAPGEQHQFVLTFLAPLGAESLVLMAGDQRFDLATILSSSGSLLNLNQSAAPETIDAVVVDVIDGESIVIEKDGVEQTVRYLGIDIPGEEDCFFAESTEANRVLVEGQQVKIERQATNVDAQGNWVRDVWVETEEGRYILVAHQLVQQGSAVADISEPNTRFTGWLRGAEAVAQAEGRGLWGACSSEQLSEFAPDPLTDNTARRIEISA